jgi:acyl-coenzyme A synthetase/AMP-(fatty) acid ligase
MPLATTLGFQVMLGTLWRGGALIMTWDARKTLAALTAYSIQNIVAASQSLLKLAEVVEGHPGYRSKLVAVFSVGALGSEQSERVRARLCPNLTMGYVARDRTMVASIPAQLASEIPGAAGYVLPGVMVEIVDDQDRPLPPGQDGHLRIRSDYGVKEYLDDPNATRRAFRNGWFYPDNRAHLTKDNVLVISSSVKSPTATDFEPVEDVLLKHKH